MSSRDHGERSRSLGPARLRLLAILLSLAAAELIAFAAFQTVLRRSRVWWRDLDGPTNAATREDLIRFRDSQWDPDIGWLRRPHATNSTTARSGRRWSYRIDEIGSRWNPYAGSRGKISLYGDSFTFGDEANDDETWGFFLSNLSKTKADNWGISGGAPDQALLRFARNLPDHRTEIAVLTIPSENIRRILGSYRPFLTGSPGMVFAFKPILSAQADGSLAWEPPALHRADDLSDFRRALERARQTDFWYTRNAGRPRRSFPYTWALARGLVAAALEDEDPYTWPTAVARLDRIIHDFSTLSEKHDVVPVVLFLPAPGQLERFSAYGEWDYREYVGSLRARIPEEFPRLRVVDLLEHDFDARLFNIAPFQHHPSVYGHQVIAGVAYSALSDLLAPTRD